jgi:C1A family cysteine protease
MLVWQGKGLGWRRDTPDIRDHRFAAPQSLLPSTLPLTVDLRPHMPGVYDQGQLGSCTANAIGAAIEYGQRRERRHEFVPSRLYIYYNERVLENSVASDCGAEIRDGIKSVATQGVCQENPPGGRYSDITIWPYNEQAVYTRPPEICYTEAAKNLVKGYARVDASVDALEQCLAVGFPVVFGVSLYSSFESDLIARTGVVLMPQPNERSLGGHAMLLVGYLHNDRLWIVRNSWGTGWGQRGYCLMPYAYLTNPDLASDFWAIRLV